ncbi:MAG: flagellar basal body L-ring protein FlgH [Planctomycetes bacterium]|nr:flagellar basal body L-ring protein FlgH [Planctomycetota bacterium]
MRHGGGILFLFIALVMAGTAFGQSRSENPVRFPRPKSGAEQFGFDQSQLTTPRSSYFDQSQLVAPLSSFNGFNSPKQQKRRMRDYSRIYIEKLQPREIKVHDIITIVVSEKAEVTLNSRFSRQRQASLKAELKEFMRLGESGNLTTAAENQPTIDATLNGRLQSTGAVKDSEGIRYRIAAMVVDIRPNGNLVLEAKKSFQLEDDAWEYSLTGILRFEDIQSNNTALSENIANLDIKRRRRGKVHNSTRRPWGVKLYDIIFPF